jgi:hypothetical protein
MACAPAGCISIYFRISASQLPGTVSANKFVFVISLPTAGTMVQERKPGEKDDCEWHSAAMSEAHTLVGVMQHCHHAAGGEVLIVTMAMLLLMTMR